MLLIPIRAEPPVPGLIEQRWVFEAIDSVLAQSYPHLRLNVVDDASPDGTLEAIRERYGDAEPRLSLLMFLLFLAGGFRVQVCARPSTV